MVRKRKEKEREKKRRERRKLSKGKKDETEEKDEEEKGGIVEIEEGGTDKEGAREGIGKEKRGGERRY